MAETNQRSGLAGGELPAAPGGGVAWPGLSQATLRGVAPRERSAADYAIEHAEYMAASAERLVESINNLVLAERQRDEIEGDEPEGIVAASDHAVDSARETVDEHMRGTVNRIYEFRKRRDRALAAPLASEAHLEPTRDDALMKLSRFAHTAAHMSEPQMRTQLADIADQLIVLAAQPAPTSLEREVQAILDRHPGAVRVREGGGPENLAASLALLLHSSSDLKHGSEITCQNVLGGWQSCIGGHLFGPICNATTDLWRWQRANLSRAQIVEPPLEAPEPDLDHADHHLEEAPRG